MRERETGRETERIRFGFARVAPPVCHGQGMTGGNGGGEWERELGGQMLWDWEMRCLWGCERRKGRKDGGGEGSKDGALEKDQVRSGSVMGSMLALFSPAGVASSDSILPPP